jgi:predicted nucleic acid-binding protein
MEIIFDSSTLILLAKTELIRLVAEDHQVLIPERVMQECVSKDIFDARMISQLITEGVIKVLKVDKKAVISKLCRDFKIHNGEAEALYLAMQRKTLLAVDDLPTIKACKIINQRFTTAVHFLINSAGHGKLDKKSAFVKLEKLAVCGRYNRQIVDDAYARLKGGS